MGPPPVSSDSRFSDHACSRHGSEASTLISPARLAQTGALNRVVDRGTRGINFILTVRPHFSSPFPPPRSSPLVLAPPPLHPTPHPPTHTHTHPPAPSPWSSTSSRPPSRSPSSPASSPSSSARPLRGSSAPPSQRTRRATASILPRAPRTHGRHGPLASLGELFWPILALSRIRAGVHVRGDEAQARPAPLRLRPSSPTHSPRLPSRPTPYPPCPPGSPSART